MAVAVAAKCLASLVCVSSVVHGARVRTDPFMGKINGPTFCEGTGHYSLGGAQSRDQGLGEEKEAESVRNSGSLIPLGLAHNGTIFVPQ